MVESCIVLGAQARSKHQLVLIDSIIMCTSKACEEPTAPGVYWHGDADWKLYDAAQAAAIQRGITDGASLVDLGQVKSTRCTSCVRYAVDLTTMKQINLTSGFTRNVIVVKLPPATPVTAPLASPAAAVAGDDDTSIEEELRHFQESIGSLKDMILKLETDLWTMRLRSVRGNKGAKCPVAADVTKRSPVP